MNAIAISVVVCTPKKAEGSTCRKLQNLGACQYCSEVAGAGMSSGLRGAACWGLGWFRALGGGGALGLWGMLGLGSFSVLGQQKLEYPICHPPYSPHPAGLKPSDTKPTTE